MSIFIAIFVIVLFAVLIGFSLRMLVAFEAKEKFKIIIIGVAICLVLTNILFFISTIGINYTNPQIKHEAQKILVLVFAPINGLITMPYIAKQMSKIKLKEIETEKVKKKIIILGIIFLIICCIEISYLAQIQTGIIDISNNISK